MARVANANIETADKYIKAVLEAQTKDWGAPLLNHLIYARRPSIFKGVRGMWTGLASSGLIDPKLGALINRRGSATKFIHARDKRDRTFLNRIGELLDVPTPGERISGLRNARLEADDLLRAQRQRRGIGGWQGKGLVIPVRV